MASREVFAAIKGYDPKIAMRVVELVAEGHTLVEIGNMEEMPSRAAVYRWLTVDPDFYEAYTRARELSANSFEEEALSMARILKGANDFTGAKVTAYNYAMQQFRWSAERRNKRDYGNMANTPQAVQIVINSSLNLGQPGAAPIGSDSQNIYHIELTPQVPDAKTFAVEDQIVPADLTPAFLEVPVEAERALTAKKARINRKHKSAASTKRTATIYAKGRLNKEAKNGQYAGDDGAEQPAIKPDVEDI